MTYREKRAYRVNIKKDTSRKKRENEREGGVRTRIKEIYFEQEEKRVFACKKYREEECKGRNRQIYRKEKERKTVLDRNKERDIG